MADEKCKLCAYCNMKKFNSGKWYCANPKVSVFDLPIPPEKPCFKKKGCDEK